MTIPSDKPEATLKPGLRQLSATNGRVAVSRETVLLRWLSDRGLCLATGERTVEFYRRLTASRLPGVVEVVPADGMLLLVLAPGMPMPAGLPELLDGLNGPPEMEPTMEHCIPVRFDGEDLPAIAGQAGYAEEGLIELLCSLTLGVKFLGFQPGFAYLDGLPPKLHLPRRPNPRKHVPAGSVALAGGYCGIYPSAGPGGWHLLGTTEAMLFDPAADPPARFRPGDTVKLVAT